jgi:hypothetical protein
MSTKGLTRNMRRVVFGGVLTAAIIATAAVAASGVTGRDTASALPTAGTASDYS